MQVISTSLRMGGRTTQVCGTQIERVVRRRERTPAPSYGKVLLRNNIVIDARNSISNI